MIFRLSSNLGHLGSENRSLGQIMENIVYSRVAAFLLDLSQIWSEVTY